MTGGELPPTADSATVSNGVPESVVEIAKVADPAPAASGLGTTVTVHDPPACSVTPEHPSGGATLNHVIWAPVIPAVPRVMSPLPVSVTVSG